MKPDLLTKDYPLDQLTFEEAKAKYFPFSDIPKVNPDLCVDCEQEMVPADYKEYGPNIIKCGNCLESEHNRKIEDYLESKP